MNRKLFFFLIKLRIHAYFSSENWKMLLLHTGVLALLFLYVFGISSILDGAQGIKIQFPKDRIIFFVNAVLFLMPFILKVFPTVVLKQPIFDKYYPISKPGLLFLDLLVFGLFRPVILFLLCFILALYFSCTVFNAHEVTKSILYILSGFLFAENVITAFSCNLIKWTIFCLFSGLVIVSSGLYWRNDFFLLLLFTVLFFQLFLQKYLFAILLQEQVAFQKKNNKDVESNGRIKWLFQKVSFRKPSFRTTMIIAFIIKLVLLYLYIPVVKDKMFTYAGNPLFFFAFVPTFLFTYIFNNLWGYFKPIAFNIVVSGGGINDLVLVYAKLLWIYIATDFFLAILAIFVFNVFSLQLLALYVLSVGFSFVIGFSGSLLRYFEVKKALSLSGFKPNTSPLVNIITILPCFIYFFLFKDTAVFISTLAGILIFSTASIFLIYRYEVYLLKSFRARMI